VQVDIFNTDKKYNIIYADPPWQFKAWSKKGLVRSAENHYSTMNIEDICTLPVASLAEENCVLFMWVTFPTMQDAFRVIKAWGFEYKTVAFVWTKQNKKKPSLFLGMGRWTRSNAEICLLATRGKPKRISAKVRQVIVSPIRAHSQKPNETRTRIKQLVGGNAIELFARNNIDGWDCWGNEVGKMDEIIDTEEVQGQSSIFDFIE